MNISKTISYAMIFIGGVVAIYANAQTNQNQYILIAGIVILMAGIYRISRNIKSRKETEDDTQNNS